MPVVLCVSLTLIHACATPKSSAPGPSASTPQTAVDSSHANTSLEQLLAATPPPPTGAEQAVQEPSSRTKTAIEKSDALIAEKRFTEATLEIERALRFSPNQPDLLIRRLRAAWLSGNKDLADQMADELLKTQPRQADALLIKGLAAASHGDFTAALSPLLAAYQIGGLTPSLELTLGAGLARCLAETGHWAAAHELLSKLKPRLAEWKEPFVADADLPLTELAAGRLMAEMSVELGRFEQAASESEALWRSGGAEADALRAANAYEQAGRIDRATQILVSIPGNNSEILDRLAELLRKQGRAQTWIDLLAQRLEKTPDDESLVLRLAEAYAAQSNPEQELNVLRSYVLAHPDRSALRARLFSKLAQESDAAAMARLVVDFLVRAPGQARAILADAAPFWPSGEPLQRLIDGLDSSPAGRFLCGLLKARLHRWDDAEATLKDLLAHPDWSQEAALALAEVYLESFQWERALELLKKHRPEETADAEWDWLAGQALDRLGRTEEAEARYKAAVLLDRGRPEIGLRLAQLYVDTNQSLQAERQLRALVQQFPQLAAARERLILLLIRMGRGAEAQSQLNELNSLAPESEEALRADAEFNLARTGDWGAFSATMRKLLEKNDQDFTSWLRLGDALLALRRPEDAVSAFEQAEKLGDSDEPVQRLILSDLLSLNYDSAIERMKRLLDRTPMDDSLRLSVVQTMYVVLRFDEAEAILKAALEDAADERAARAYQRELADCLLRSRARDERLEVMKRWASEGPNADDWRVEYVEALIDAKRAEEAVAVSRDYLDEHDEDLQRALYVEALLAAGRKEEAVAVHLEPLLDDPTNDRFVLRLVDTLVEANQETGALELARGQVKISRAPEIFQDQIIRALNAMGRHDDAILEIQERMRRLEAMAMADPRTPAAPSRGGTASEDLPRLFDLLIQEYIDAGNGPFAERLLRQVIQGEAVPQNRFRHLRLLAAALQLHDDAARAIPILEECLKLQPVDAGINNDLGYLLADLGLRLEEAEAMVRLAVSRPPPEPAYLDSYGWVMYKMGRFAEALTWLQRAAGNDPEDDPEILDHMGDAFWRQADSGEALRRWRLALAAGEVAAKDVKMEDPRRTRLLETLRNKIQAAEAGQKPAVAPTAVEQQPQNGP